MARPFPTSGGLGEALRMLFELPEDDDPLVRAAWQVAEDVLVPAASAVDSGWVPASHLAAIGAAGLLGLQAPVQVGGSDAAPAVGRPGRRGPAGQRHWPRRRPGKPRSRCRAPAGAGRAAVPGRVPPPIRASRLQRDRAGLATSCRGSWLAGPGTRRRRHRRRRLHPAGRTSGLLRRSTLPATPRASIGGPTDRAQAATPSGPRRAARTWRPGGPPSNGTGRCHSYHSSSSAGSTPTRGQPTPTGARTTTSTAPSRSQLPERATTPRSPAQPDRSESPKAASGGSTDSRTPTSYGPARCWSPSSRRSAGRRSSREPQPS